MNLIQKVRMCGAALAALGLSAGIITTASAEPAAHVAADTRADVAEKLVGTWRLKSAVTRDQQGNGGPFYEDAIGKLTYTARGDVWALTGSRGQPGVWYTGTFDVKPKSHTAVHHVQYSSVLDWEGTDLPRRYKFRGDRLTLTAELTADTSLVLVWKRL